MKLGQSILRLVWLASLVSPGMVAACTSDSFSSTTDASTDAAVAGDATGDAGDASTLAFCATVSADFCADFDTVQVVGDNWSQVTTVGGPVQFGVPFTSPPRAASMTLGAAADAAPFAAAIALLKVVNAGGKRTIRFESDVDFEHPNATAYNLVQYASLAVGDFKSGASLVRSAAGFKVLVFDQTKLGDAGDASTPYTTFFDLSSQPKTGQFVHMTFDVTFAVVGHVALTFDGVSVLDVNVFTRNASVPINALGATAGSVCGAPPCFAETVRYDNVVVKLAQ